MGKRAKATGDCFEAAYHTALTLDVDEGDRVWVCHGHITVRVGRIGHAWVEVDGGGREWVWESSQGFNSCGEKEKYYTALSAELVKRYTVEQASKLLNKTEHYGPWDKRIKQKKSAG
jgi:hypothetical protein